MILLLKMLKSYLEKLNKCCEFSQKPTISKITIFGIFDEKFEQNVLEVANYKQPLIVRGTR